MAAPHLAPDLTGVPETTLWTLYHRAAGADPALGLLHDPEARRLVQQIDYPFRRRFGPGISAFALRARTFDAEVRRFLSDAPDGVVVSLGEGLETQRMRVDNGRLRWVSVDLPESITLRDRLLPTNDRHLHIAADATTLTWVDSVPRDRPCFVVAQGLLMYLEPEQVQRILVGIAARLPGAGMMFDTVPPWLLAWTRLGLPVAPRYRAPRMAWGTSIGRLDTLRDWVPTLREISTIEYAYPHGLRRYLLRSLRRSPGLRLAMPAIVKIRFGAAYDARRESESVGG